MRELGIAAIIASLLMIVLTLILWLFSENKQITSIGEHQFLDVSAANVRKNDAYFHKFLENIKLNKGVLILGTSESGPLNGYNYTELLNSDPNMKTAFSTFYGAGRFCDMYLPLIAESPELWKNLKILVFVNPTYWRQGLNEPSETYQTRYLDVSLVEASRKKLKAYDFDYLLGDVHASLRLSRLDRIDDYLEKNIESLYYNNLNSYFNPVANVYGFFNGKKEIEFNAFRLESLKQEIDSTYNASFPFLEKNRENLVFPPLDSIPDYRFRSLEAFIKICKDKNIRARFVIGPYNGVMADYLNVSNTISEYKKLRLDLLEFFESRNQKIIDLTDLSSVNHTFIDVQHHSAYGGYLIYKRIKEYYD